MYYPWNILIIYNPRLILHKQGCNIKHMFTLNETSSVEIKHKNLPSFRASHDHTIKTCKWAIWHFIAHCQFGNNQISLDASQYLRAINVEYTYCTSDVFALETDYELLGVVRQWCWKLNNTGYCCARVTKIKQMSVRYNTRVQST